MMMMMMMMMMIRMMTIMMMMMLVMIMEMLMMMSNCSYHSCAVSKSKLYIFDEQSVEKHQSATMELLK